VAAFHFSRRAEDDLLAIGEYTLRTWGKTQAARYLLDLEEFCRKLSVKPDLGRSCDHIRPGLRCMEHGKHVVFYRSKPDGILISRILHQRMSPDSQFKDDEADES
jgi:toxin ParE1/3/4